MILSGVGVHAAPCGHRSLHPASDFAAGLPICDPCRTVPRKDPHDRDPHTPLATDHPPAPLTATIDESRAAPKDLLATLQEGVTKPHVFDDATVERICRQFTETLEFIRIHEEQRARWRTATSIPPTAPRSTG